MKNDNNRKRGASESSAMEGARRGRRLGLKLTLNSTFVFVVNCERTVSLHDKATTKANRSPKGIIWSAVPLLCYFDVVKSQRVAG